MKSKLLATAGVVAFAGLIACGGGNTPPPSPSIAGSGGMALGGAGATSSAGMTMGGQLVAGSGSLGGALATGGAAGGADGGSPGGGAGAGGGAGGGSAGGGAGASGGGQGGQGSVEYPAAAEVLEVLTRVNAQFANKWPDPGKPIVVNGTSRPSNIWTRAVYYEGLLGLYEVDPQPSYLSYAVAWAEAHEWKLRNNDSFTTNADNQCAGQTYIDLYRLDGAKDPTRIAAIRSSIDNMLANDVTNVWTWVDAIQMAMPVFARFGVLYPDGDYLEAMHALYTYPKRTAAGGLYSTTDHLWWRDDVWKAQKTPGGKQVYWSRGNGWVFAALVRVLDILPATDPRRAEYAQDFTDMAAALLAVQRSDGFWNPSLVDPMHYGGPEASGTALFIYGMAWGIRKGLLDEAIYGPVIVHAWKSLVNVAIHDDGFVGYLQSTGEDPADGQPLSYDKVPDFEDYGVGCVLLAGSELVKLSKP